MLAQEIQAANDDPAYPQWSETQHAAEVMAFDAWLASPAGRAWLAAEEFESISRQEGYGPHMGAIQ